MIERDAAKRALGASLIHEHTDDQLGDLFLEGKPPARQLNDAHQSSKA
jgi:hypothetical protein